MTKKYVDRIGAFQYQTHTIAAHVVKPATVPAPEGQKGLPPRAFWRITVGSNSFDAFPAWPDDTEQGVRERIKRWIDEHLRRA
jgi:hypothetical protein